MILLAICVGKNAGSRWGSEEMSKATFCFGSKTSSNVMLSSLLSSNLRTQEMGQMLTTIEPVRPALRSACTSKLGLLATYVRQWPRISALSRTLPRAMRWNGQPKVRVINLEKSFLYPSVARGS